MFSQSLWTSSFRSQEKALPVCWKPQAFWDQLNRGCAHPHSVGFPIHVGIKPIEKAKQTRLRQGSNQHGVCPEYLEGIKMQFIHGEKGNALITTFSDFSFFSIPFVCIFQWQRTTRSYLGDLFATTSRRAFQRIN